MVVARARRSAPRHEARRDPRVHRDAARAVRRARRRTRSTFRVMVKEAKQKVLPELTDEWVDEASEFETVDELRADIRRRLEIDAEPAGADGASATRCSKPRPTSCRSRRPKTLVESETRRRVEDLAHRLSHQGATLEQYLETTGQEPQAFIDEIRVGAARARARRPRAARGRRPRRRSLPSDEEVDAEMCSSPSAPSRSPQRCGASSNGVARWRRYALMLPEERHSSSSSITRPWSTRTATRSISRARSR